MKTIYTFHFADEPQFKVPDSREHIAHLLRSYRAHPKRCILKKTGKGYSVRLSGHTVEALIERTYSTRVCILRGAFSGALPDNEWGKENG